MSNKIIIIVIVVLTVLAVICYPFFMEKMAYILMVSDPLEKADAIVVLGGDLTGSRVEEGVKLYKSGYAPLMVMSGGPLAWHLISSEHMKKHAILLGVPAKDILVQTKSLSTLEDAIFTLPILRKHNVNSIILVTSPYHMRRARRAFSQIVKRDGIKVICHPAMQSSFNPKRWWKRDEDTSLVVHEYIGFLGYMLKGF